MVLPHFPFPLSRAGAPVGPKPASPDPLASSVQLVFGRPNRRRPVPEASGAGARRTQARGLRAAVFLVGDAGSFPGGRPLPAVKCGDGTFDI